MVEPDRLQMTMWRMRVPCLINEAIRAQAHAHLPTKPHTYTRTYARTRTKKYVILIGFLRQEWFCERASLLRYTYIAGFF